MEQLGNPKKTWFPAPALESCLPVIHFRGAMLGFQECLIGVAVGEKAKQPDGILTVCRDSGVLLW